MILLGISYFSFAQGVSLTITDAEIYDIDIETTTGTQNNPHNSCCEPFSITVTFYNLPITSSQLFLEIYYFRDDQEFDFIDCDFCSEGTIGSSNKKVVISKTVPGAVEGNPTEYEMTILVPHYNTSDSPLYIKYYDDDGDGIPTVTNMFIYIDPFNCPTSESKVSKLIDDEGWPTATESCNNGGVFNGKLRPHVDIHVDILSYCVKGNTSGTREPINFGPGTQLIVEEGNTLTVDYVHFYSCYDKMWKGIYVEKGAELIMKNSIIEDAEFAITLEKGAKLTLEDNEFIDNYVAIKALPSDLLFGDNTTISSFKNNAFKGTGTLVDKYDGQNTNPQDYPYAGILIGSNQAGSYPGGTLRFTASLADKNEFSEMANGILNRKYGANLFVKGATFKNINDSYGSGYTVKGFGIKHDAQLLSCLVNGFDNWSGQSSFDNVDVCLQTNLASIVKFDKQEVINSGRGVYSTKTLAASYINNNSFSTEKTAIEVANTNLVLGDFEIIGNDVDLDISVPDITENRGIKLTNVTGPTSNPYSTRLIDGNNIDAEYAVVGIELDMVKNLEVVDNFIQIPPDVYGYIGISTIDAEKLILTCNDIQGHYNLSGNDEYVKGISFSGMNKCFITCNDIQRTKIGVHFEKMSTRAHLKGNVFNEHSVGLQYGTTQHPNGQSGPQYYNGNKWISGYNTLDNEFGAKHYAVRRKAIISEYKVNDNQGSDYTTVDDPDFVKEEYDKNNFSCDSLQLSCVELGLVNTQWDKLDSVSLTDTLFEEQYLRDLQWKVYKNMKDSIIDYNYSLDTIAQNIGLDELYSADSELKSIKALLHYNLSTDSLFSNEGVDTLSSAFMDSIVYNELSSGLDSMKVAVTSYVVNEDYNINSEDYYIGNMSDALYYEAKLLKQDAGVLDSFSIGFCSFFGGEAWDRMNSILPSHLISHTLDTACAGVYPRESFGEESKQYELTISPNPVQNELTVYNIKGGEKVEYRIFDMNGRIVQKGYVSAEANDVLLGDSFGAGVYILTLKGNYKSIKFVVIR